MGLASRASLPCDTSKRLDDFVLDRHVVADDLLHAVDVGEEFVGVMAVVDQDVEAFVGERWVVVMQLEAFDGDVIQPFPVERRFFSDRLELISEKSRETRDR